MPDPSFGKTGGTPPGRGVTALDTDRDGVIDAAELAAAPAALRTLDTDGIGKLTADELRPGGPSGDRPSPSGPRPGPP